MRSTILPLLELALAQLWMAASGGLSHPRGLLQHGRGHRQLNPVGGSGLPEPCPGGAGVCRIVDRQVDLEIPFISF